MKKKIAIIFFTLATLGALTVGVVTANAQGWKGGQDNMVTALAKKLGISEDKVKNAFDAIQKDKQAEMQKLFEEKLTAAVKDGKLTEAQKKLILEKHAAMKKARETSRNQMVNEREDSQNWAEKNGIDESWLFGGFGRKMGMRGGMRGW